LEKIEHILKNVDTVIAIKDCIMSHNESSTLTVGNNDLHIGIYSIIDLY
jgi:hypothetical protein